MILNVVSSGNEDYYSLIIYSNSGAQVTVENEYETFVKTTDNKGSVAFCVTEGYWNIVSTKDGQSKTASINVVKDNILDMMFHYYPEFVYDGEYEIINEDEMNWHIKFKTSGTLSFSNLNSVANGIDVFLVGGGGGGVSDFGSGGGGGYTKTVKNHQVATSGISVVIGAGGSAASSGSAGNGGATSFGSLSVDGGVGASTNNTASGSHGGNGGSGGGGFGGTAGSDGGNGSGGSGNKGGTGQGSTTREFGESNGALYSTGGTPEQGSAGIGTPGVNTGFGGNAGGNGYSGIVIIRNKRS